MTTLPPKIDPSTFQQRLEETRAKAPFYTPEWNARQDKDGAQALLRISLRLLEHVTRQLNKTPDKNFIAFLHHLGMQLQPAQSARAVVTFTLAEGTTEHVAIPKGTQLAGEGLDGEEVIFETETALRATPALLQAIYSLYTGNDAIYEHTAKLNSPDGFELFTGQNQQEHSLYIGHAELFDQANPSCIAIEFTITVGASLDALVLVWEYWDGQRWVALQTFPDTNSGQRDTTNLFSRSGRMILKKLAGEFAPREVNGIESRWLRCRLKNTLSSLTQIRLPEINTLRINVSPSNPFPAELAFHNDIPLNLDKLSTGIHPFGQLPRLFDTLYIASDEAFSKRGARITLIINSHWFDPANTGASPTETTNENGNAPNPTLSWEYWNGKGWRILHDLVDSTDKFKKPKDISFTCPVDIEKVEINGENKFWIRARLIDGDYGKEFVIKPKSGVVASTEVEFAEGTVRYPIITKLEITYKNVPREPEQCLSLNNLNYEDHLGALLNTTQTFAPYHILPERLPGIFLGFNKKLEGGPISIFFHLQEPLSSQEIKMNWFYWNGDSWVLLNVRDSTRNLTQIGLLEFAVPNDRHERELFDKVLFWLKGSVVEGDLTQKPKLFSIWVNSTYATQASVVEDEIVGSSQVVAHQEFPLLNPMIINQAVFVLETTDPSEEERQAILAEEGADAIAEQKDASGEIQHFKIRWHEVDDFDFSTPYARHYIADKRLGVIKFGDGVQGMIPPPGADNIRANYRFGGGTNGNIEAGKISSLKNAIPFVDQVTNHLRADGGSDTETLDEVRIRGPQTLKHRERAISPSDFEALAKSASRTVVRAKCLANTNSDGESAPGHVSVIIVPVHQIKNEPPSRILCTTVADYLKAHTANTLGSDTGLDVRGAKYIQIAIEPTIIPTTLEAAVGVEDAVIKTLQRYIHPLTGGPDEDGWVFGATICRTELFALLESIQDVDHVQDIVIRVEDEVKAGDVVMGPEQLPFSGEHKVNIQSPGASSKRAASPLDSTCADSAVG